ncbi:hypothetical protein COOONC_18742, partial [Cooperia oncophora]
MRRTPYTAFTESIDDCFRASVSSQGNRKPILTASQRAIIKYCIDNAKDDIAERIIRRATERKDDFKMFIDNLTRVRSNFLCTLFS